MTQLNQVQLCQQVVNDLMKQVDSQLSDHVWVKFGVKIGGQVVVEVRVKVWYQVREQINDTT
jgi:hypothetical protein